MKKRDTLVDDKLLALEIHDRKMNLLFYGIQQVKGENSVSVARDIFNDLGITKDIPLVNVHRLPRAVKENAQPDPIIVRFVSMIDRDAVFNAYQQRLMKKAATTGDHSSGPPPTFAHLRIATDLPAILKRKRYLLEKQAYSLRKEQNKSTRIKLLGVKLCLQVKEKGSQGSWENVAE